MPSKHIFSSLYSRLHKKEMRTAGLVISFSPSALNSDISILGKDTIFKCSIIKLSPVLKETAFIIIYFFRELKQCPLLSGDQPLTSFLYQLSRTILHEFLPSYFCLGFCEASLLCAPSCAA